MQDEVAVNAPDVIGLRVGGQCVAELAGADFADPLVVLVLVVDKRGQQAGRDDGQLGRGADFTGGDVADAGMDALGDGFAEGRKPSHRRQGAAKLFGSAESIRPSKAGSGLGSAAARLRIMK
jgi:hypothetical protein